jgi:chromatin remodeling complex protein RSC6
LLYHDNLANLVLLADINDCQIAFLASTGQMKGMAKTSKTSKRTPNAAFMKPVTPDETLAKVVGDKPLPRTELTKKLWAYIKKNGLQDAKKKTLINADENLKNVFNGKKQVSMFEMTKLVSGHVKK